MEIEKILTDMLNTYTGLPDVCIIKRDSKYIATKDTYICAFADGVNVSVSFSTFDNDADNECLQDLAFNIHQMYLKESQEYGMNCK